MMRLQTYPNCKGSLAISGILRKTLLSVKVEYDDKKTWHSPGTCYMYISIYHVIFSRNQLIELPGQTKLIISNAELLLSSLKVSIAIPSFLKIFHRQKSLLFWWQWYVSFLRMGSCQWKLLFKAIRKQKLKTTKNQMTAGHLHFE